MSKSRYTVFKSPQNSGFKRIQSYSNEINLGCHEFKLKFSWNMSNKLLDTCFAF